MVLKIDKGNIFIENWFMSCRVLKRTMEKFVLNHIVEFTIKNNYNLITGEYIKTLKNVLVKDHFKSLGFTKNNNLWVLDPKNYKDLRTFIK